MARALGDGWLLPEADGYDREAFTAGAVRIRRCSACARFQFPPEDVCAGCGASGFDIFTSRGKGRVESVAVVHHPVHRLLEPACPYAIVVVSLEDVPGVHLIGNPVGCAPGDVRIGDRVRAVFEAVRDPETDATLRLPQWERLGTAPSPD